VHVLLVRDSFKPGVAFGFYVAVSLRGCVISATFFIKRVVSAALPLIGIENFRTRFKAEAVYDATRFSDEVSCDSDEEMQRFISFARKG